MCAMDGMVVAIMKEMQDGRVGVEQGEVRRTDGDADMGRNELVCAVRGRWWREREREKKKKKKGERGRVKSTDNDGVGVHHTLF